MSVWSDTPAGEVAWLQPGDGRGATAAADVPLPEGCETVAVAAAPSFDVLREQPATSAARSRPASHGQRKFRCRAGAGVLQPDAPSRAAVCVIVIEV